MSAAILFGVAWFVTGDAGRAALIVLAFITLRPIALHLHRYGLHRRPSAPVKSKPAPEFVDTETGEVSQ